jgi:hypothetical protein
MITIRKVHPSGALEVSALVRQFPSREVWLERRAYYDYTKQEARKLFIQHLTANHLALVND